MGKEVIKTTMNVKLFELLPTNRDTKKTTALTKSMQEHGWLKAYPLYCVRNGNGKYTIIDGHHRFEVACRLGIPIRYVVDEKRVSIFEIDDTTNKWSVEDHLTSQCRAGNVDYHKIKKYINDTGIGILPAISMLYGHSAGSHNVGKIFKKGEFLCRDTTNADTVRDIVMFMKRCGIVWAHHVKLVSALSRIAFVPEFSPDTLKEKVKSYPYMIQKQPHLEGYMEMIETAYNFRSRTKVPLKFLADEAARKRNIATK
ncbi:MAG: ParB-like nuclease domain protein [Firmicutes bacterium ADurb.Bin182]|nr:MAG: ParB-like nuclease domain protein [Firmicutes bacterium ADurb.Bin182]